MTYAELLDCLNNTPVKLADNNFGLLIRWAEHEAGVQVFGESNIRWIPLDRLVKNHDGTIDETPEKRINR